MSRTDPLSSNPDELHAELRRVVRAGFPITDESAGALLLQQRSVVAHARHPEERASRIAALERVLREKLDALGPSNYGAGARILLGADRGLTGTTLTFRRGEAANALEFSLDHVRKHVEPKILRQLAFSIHKDNLSYTPVRDGGRPPIAPNENAPILTEDSLTQREELMCRVWSDVYGYRGTIIAVRRSTEIDEPSDEVEEHVATSKWYLARLLTSVSTFLDRFGTEMLHGETPYNVEGLVALAGWTGGLADEEARTLRYALARAGPHDRIRFLEELDKVRSGQTS